MNKDGSEQFKDHRRPLVTFAELEIFAAAAASYRPAEKTSDFFRANSEKVADITKGEVTDETW